jgi:hypothetical protein
LGIHLPEIPENINDDDEEEAFPVYPENWDAVETFCRCGTQWIFGAMGGVIGLNYACVESVLRLTRPKSQHDDLFTAIQVMEKAALKVMNSKSK